MTSRISPRALLADPQPAASTQETTTSAPSGPETPEFTGEPSVATDAGFCAELRGLEELQGQYVAGDEAFTTWLDQSCPRRRGAA